MSTDDASEDLSLVLEFIEEANERLDVVDEDLVRLEGNPGDEELIHRVFRCIHSIKGVSSMLELLDITHLSHRMETLLDDLRSGRIEPDASLVDLLFRGCDILKSLIGELSNTIVTSGQLPVTSGDPRVADLLAHFEPGSHPAPASPAPAEDLAGSDIVVESAAVEAEAEVEEEVVESFPPLPESRPNEGLAEEYQVEVREHLDHADDAMMLMEENRDDREALKALFRAIHSFKGASGFVGFVAAERLAHALENLLDKVRNDQSLVITGDFLDIVFEMIDMLRKMAEEATSTVVDVLACEAKIARQLERLTSPPPPSKAAAEEVAAESERPSSPPPPDAEPLLEPSVPVAGAAAEVTDATAPTSAAAEVGDAAGDVAVSQTAEQAAQSVSPSLTPEVALAHLRDFLGKAQLGHDFAPGEWGIYFDALASLRALADATSNPRLIEPLDLLDPCVQTLHEGTVQFVDPLLELTADGIAALEKVLAIESTAGVVPVSPPAPEPPKAPPPSAPPAQATPASKPSPAEPPAAPASKAAAPPPATPAAPPAPKAEAKSDSKPPVKTESKGTPAPASPPAASPAAKAAPPKAAAEPQAAAAPAAASTMRIDPRMLDVFMNLVGELIVSRNAFGHIGRGLSGDDLQRQAALSDFNKLARDVMRISREMQQCVMEMRMIPVRHVFQKFPRMVRDISRKTGKQVELVLQGEDTEIDKTIAEEIADPLVHLVRNAVDHGVEPPDRRREVGKPEKGTVTLRAGHEGNNILIEILDDGGGINPDRILAKAIEKGLTTTEVGETLSREQILDFIFAPGFSTASQITDISGRGVGMDVVRTNLKRVKGNISVSSEVGSGSRFRLELPLTMAVIEALLVEVAGATYALPIHTVAETVKVARGSLRVMMDQHALTLRGEIVGVAMLQELLGMPPEKNVDPAREIPIVLLEIGTERLGLAVDALRRPEEIVVKPLPDYLAAIPGLAGASILGDGKAILILDPIQLMSMAHRQPGALELEAAID